jgi:ferredoxin
MTFSFLRSKQAQTRFVQLDTSLCEACWKCVGRCHRQVIDRIDLWFHKHARIAFPDQCTGCLKCVKACESGAFTARPQPSQE